MDFINTIKSETERKYFRMLDGQAEEPMSYPDMGDYQVFERKNAAYRQRLEQEFSQFNNAVRDIRAKRDRRISSENNEIERRAEQNAHKKYVCAKTFKAIALFLPIIIAILVGIDIFSNRAIYEVKASYGGVITGWVFFALISVVLSIFGLVKLFTKEVYHNRNRIDNTRTYRTCSIVAFVMVAILCIANLGTYIKWGVDEAAALTEHIATFPTNDSIDYAEYDEDIAETYTTYNAMDFWQKPLVENRDKLLSIVSEYNLYKVENVRLLMERITPENVSDGVLKDAVDLYSRLNDEQVQLLSKDESIRFNAFVTVYKVINGIDAIDNDILNQYNKINSLLDMYDALDLAYKPYVYNFDLVHEFEVRYLREPRYSQMSTGMFLTRDTNNPHTPIAVSEFSTVDKKYISASLNDKTVLINKPEKNDAGLSGVYSYVLFTIETTITPHTEYTITYSYSMYLDKIADSWSKMWTCNELMYFGNEDKTNEAVLSRYSDLSSYGVEKLIADRSNDGDEKRTNGSFIVTYSNDTDSNIVNTDYFFVWGGVYPGSSYRCGVDASITVDCSIEVSPL